MSTTKRIQLSAMMFLQFMLLAAFFPQLSDYLSKIGASTLMIATIMSTMSIGMLLSPLVGMVADRFLNSEKVLFILNFCVAIFLALAASVSDHTMIFVCMLLAMFFYMPTWGLTSSIAITNSTAEAFPSIRVFGSIGWVCAAVFALFSTHILDKNIDGTNIPLYCGAAVAVLATLLALTLPKTPPPAKGKPMSITDAMGLESFKLMKDKNFAMFIIGSCLVMLAFVIYWLFFGMYLGSVGIKSITLTMSIGQISEMLFIVLLPFAIKKFGLKNTILMGIAAMIVRYISCFFGGESHAFTYLAIAVHGIIFGFFFVAGQIYVSKKAPKDLQAQAQGFLFLMVFGVAQYIGAYLTGYLIGANTSGVEPLVVVDWKNVFMIEVAISIAAFAFFFFAWKDDTSKE